MHYAIDLSPTPIPLSSRWTAIVLEPLPGIAWVGLCFEGELVELVDEPDDVRAYLAALTGAPVGAARRG